MENYIIQFINQFSYIATFLLILLENIFPPIPSEIILTFSGYLVSKNSLNIFFMILFSTLGSYIGSQILYYLGYFFNQSKFKNFLCKMHFDLNKVESSITWFHTYGNKTIFYFRFIPIIRSLISIPAGISKMNQFIFSIYTILGSLIWNTILILLGFYLQENYALISEYLKDYFIFILSIIIIFIIYKYKKRKKD